LTWTRVRTVKNKTATKVAVIKLALTNGKMFLIQTATVVAVSKI